MSLSSPHGGPSEEDIRGSLGELGAESTDASRRGDAIGPEGALATPSSAHPYEAWREWLEPLKLLIRHGTAYYARRKGPHWAAREDEVKALAESGAMVLEKWFGSFSQYGPEFAFAMAAVTYYAPRKAQDKRNAVERSVSAGSPSRRPAQPETDPGEEPDGDEFESDHELDGEYDAEEFAPGADGLGTLDEFGPP